MKVSYANILKKIKENKSFGNLSSDEDTFVKDTIKGGLTEDQIMRGLEARRKYQAETPTPQGEEDAGSLGEESNDQFDNNKTPFNGLSKQEVLRLAFMSGITKKSALKDISDTYDMVVTGDKSDEELKQENFMKAKQFIADNPDASREELLVAIRQHTNLDVSDASALLGEAGILSSKDQTPLTDDNLRAIASSLVQKNTGLFANKDEGLKKAKAQIDLGKIKVNGKEAILSSSQIEKIKQYMDEEYPKGRTFLQRLLPGGK